MITEPPKRPSARVILSVAETRRAAVGRITCGFVCYPSQIPRSARPPLVGFDFENIPPGCFLPLRMTQNHPCRHWISWAIPPTPVGEDSILPKSTHYHSMKFDYPSVGVGASTTRGTIQYGYRNFITKPVMAAEGRISGGCIHYPSQIPRSARPPLVGFDFENIPPGCFLPLRMTQNHPCRHWISWAIPPTPVGEDSILPKSTHYHSMKFDYPSVGVGASTTRGTIQYGYRNFITKPVMAAEGRISGGCIHYPSQIPRSARPPLVGFDFENIPPGCFLPLRMTQNHPCRHWISWAIPPTPVGEDSILPKNTHYHSMKFDYPSVGVGASTT